MRDQNTFTQTHLFVIRRNVVTLRNRKSSFSVGFQAEFYLNIHRSVMMDQLRQYIPNYK